MIQKLPDGRSAIDAAIRRVASECACSGSGSGRRVIVGKYVEDASPPKWAFGATLLTPWELLSSPATANSAQLRDIAVLSVDDERIECKPSACSFKFKLTVQAQAQAQGGGSKKPWVGGWEEEEGLDEERSEKRRLAPSVKELPFLQIASKEELTQLQTGVDDICLLGYPVGARSVGSSLCVATGQLNARKPGSLFVDGFIHSGSSGGPALNLLGRIVGIISSGGGFQELSQIRTIDLAEPAGDFGLLSSHVAPLFAPAPHRSRSSTTVDSSSQAGAGVPGKGKGKNKGRRK